MTTTNKITRLFPEPSSTISDENIQDHLDEMNEDGWKLIAVVDFIGWYRFFWAKEVE
jgi:hypothetical protein